MARSVSARRRRRIAQDIEHGRFGSGPGQKSRIGVMRSGDRLIRHFGALPAIGIVHLGLGAFFRAHGAIYIEEAMAASGGDWGICGVSLQSAAVRDALKPQGGCYTALELGPTGRTARLVSSVQEVLVAPENPKAVLGRMTDPATKIVSLTVTEKGYCHDPAKGRLNLSHPDIQHDLTVALPRSAIGYLVRALQARRAAGLAPFTVLTCDNLPHNGRMLRGLVLELAKAIDPALAGWIANKGRFPCTMVDRIVPATTAEDIAAVTALTNWIDAAPVVHEPFRQWVIEDDFVGGARPDLAAAGVQMVKDVAPYELMKLRMLNGTHSALAYLGYLAGHETIADCMADATFASFVHRLWNREIIPALTPPSGETLAPMRQPWPVDMPTPVSGTGPGRLQWMAARNCRNAFLARWRITSRRGVTAPASASPLPPG